MKMGEDELVLIDIVNMYPNRVLSYVLSLSLWTNSIRCANLCVRRINKESAKYDKFRTMTRNYQKINEIFIENLGVWRKNRNNSIKHPSRIKMRGANESKYLSVLNVCGMEVIIKTISLIPHFLLNSTDYPFVY